MSKLQFPSRAQERRWFGALQKAKVNRERATGRRLRNTIRKTYGPLVVKVARLCVAQDRKTYPFVESKRKGMRGLTKAIESYKPKSSYRFLTYAIWWIRKAIKGNQKRAAENQHRSKGK